MILDSRTKIAALDRSNMAALLHSFPDQVLEGSRIGLDAQIPRRFGARCTELVFTGLGGSAIGADLIRSYLADKIKIPVFVNRNYSLPAFISSRSLVIVSSYSGNTEETVSAYTHAKRKGAKMLVITSGGVLARRAKRDHIPLVSIPSGLPPRCALGYSFFVPLFLLWKMNMADDPWNDMQGVIRLLRNMRDTRIGCRVATGKNIAKKLAESLRGKFPVIYGGQDHIDSVVTRWRGQIGENAKVLSSSNIIPEMNHNEIVGWQNPEALLKKFLVIMLRDKGDHPRIKRRIDITKRIIQKGGIEVIELYTCGPSLLARIFSLIYLGDFTSFYLALLYNQDPTPVKRIDFLKSSLAKRG